MRSLRQLPGPQNIRAVGKQGEVYHYLVGSDQVNGKDRYDLTELRTIHHWLIKAQLRTVPGVAEVNTWGGYEKQYHVLFDPSLLAKYDLTLGGRFVDSLRTNNGNVGGGNVQQSDQVRLIQGVGMLTSTADIAGIVLKHHEGQPVRVNDVAQVEINHEIQSGAVTTMGRGQVVLGLGFMLLGENSLRGDGAACGPRWRKSKRRRFPGVIVEEALVPRSWSTKCWRRPRTICFTERFWSWRPSLFSAEG